MKMGEEIKNDGGKNIVDYKKDALKEQYEKILEELGEKYNISLGAYKDELNLLKTQLSINEFIDIAEKKAETIRKGDKEYKEFKNELIEKLEEIKNLIDSLTPELISIKKDLLHNSSQRSLETKKYLVKKGRLESIENVKNILLEIEKKMKNILKPLGSFGLWLLTLFTNILQKADVKEN